MKTNGSLASPRKVVSIVTGPVQCPLCFSKLWHKCLMLPCSFHLFLMVNFSDKKAQFSSKKVPFATKTTFSLVV